MTERAEEMSKAILIADDSQEVRRHVTRILRSNQDFEICAEAVNGQEAVAKAREFHPDLVIGTLVRHPHLWPLAFLPFIIFVALVIVFSSNAVNLTSLSCA